MSCLFGALTFEPFPPLFCLCGMDTFLAPTLGCKCVALSIYNLDMLVRVGFILVAVAVV